MAQTNKIKIRRGLNSALPLGGTEAGEPRYSTDTKELYIDDGTNNVKVGSDQTLLAPLASPALTGTPTVPTASAGTSTTQAASTAFVTTADNLKAPLASPTFTGTPAAPTASPGTNTTQLATTAFVTAAAALKADLASPTFTGVPAAPTASGGTNTTQIATTAFVTSGLSGKGDASTNTSSSVDSEVVLFSSTAGKTLKRATGTGLATLTSGVLGAVTAPSGAVVGTTDTQTLSAKRITPRVTSTASSATPTPNLDNEDQYQLTALAAAAAFGQPGGTSLTDGQSLVIRIKDNGTARALTWNSIYRAIGVTLPTTTVVSKTMYVGARYNAVDTKWDVLAVASEA